MSDVVGGAPDVLGSSGGSGTDLPPIVGTTVAALNAGLPGNGQRGLLRLDANHELELVYDVAGSRWVQIDPHLLMDQSDTWGMDLSNHTIANIRANWCRFYSALPYDKARTYLTAQATAGAATLTVADTTTFAAAGNLRIRGDVVAYTGKTGTTFTGVTGLTVTQNASTTLITQGEVGGWGTNCKPLDRVGELYTAGLHLETMANAFMNGSQDNIALQIRPYYFNANLAESFNLPATVTPAGGLGLGLTLTGPTAPGSANRVAERAFQQVISDWATIEVTPAKRFLMAALYGRMAVGTADDNGEEYGFQLLTRWVS